MQISFYNLISMAILGLAMGACSGSADDVAGRIPRPDLGGAGGSAEKINFFSGTWVADCQPESTAGARSSVTTFDFEEDELVLGTQFYTDEDCTNEGQYQSLEGTFETSNGNFSGDNIMTFDFEIAPGQTQKLFMRTMYFDETFIVTRMKGTKSAVEKEAARIVLTRQED